MELEALINTIANVGFPIAIAVYMMYYCNTLNKLHKEEIDQLRQTIENNTLAVTKMLEHIKTDN